MSICVSVLLALESQLWDLLRDRTLDIFLYPVVYVQVNSGERIFSAVELFNIVRVVGCGVSLARLRITMSLFRPNACPCKGLDTYA